MSSIQINFIRTPNGDGHDDDILKISKTNERQYSLSYKDTTQKTVVPQVIHLDREGLFDHLDTTFDMLNIDIIPFKQIQIFAPAFPSILLYVNYLNVEEIRETVFRVVENTLDNWSA